LPVGLSAILGYIHWLDSISLESLLLKFGLKPPEIIVEDEKFLKQNGEQTYAPLIVDPQPLVVWAIGYTHSLNEKNLESFFRRYVKRTDSPPIGSVTDGWKPSKKMLRKVCPGIKLGECHQHARMKMDRDCAKMKSAHKNWIDDEDETVDVNRFLKRMFCNVLWAKNELEYDQALMEFEEFTDLDPLLQSRWNSLARKRDEYLLCRKEIGLEKVGGGEPFIGCEKECKGNDKPFIECEKECKGYDKPFIECEKECKENDKPFIGCEKECKGNDKPFIGCENRKGGKLKLPTTTVSIDRRIKFLDRKFQMMQTIRIYEGGIKTLTAWAITRNFWRYYPGAKNEGKSPVELAGANLNNLPRMQAINLYFLFVLVSMKLETM